jgi:hypothetical protein
VTLAELALVGALGVTGLGLVAFGVRGSRRRRAQAMRQHELSRSARRAYVELEEDPIVAALGVGGASTPRRRP